MNPMIEAAARAMYERNERANEADWHGYSAIPWDDVSAVTKNAYLDDATAALRATMEPKCTTKMRVAIREAVHADKSIDDIWRALLGAIIGEVE